jgi:predicted metal-dependent phosphoesterase TrpH
MKLAPKHSGFADLHLHTKFSDGSWTPDDLVREAARQKFAAIAVTDHDTVDGVAETVAAGKKFGVEVIAGAEITCKIADADAEFRELHMLAYFFGDGWRDENFRKTLEKSREVRVQRIHAIVEKLNELKVPLTVSDVEMQSDCGTLGRPHIAMALKKRGIVGSVDEAFRRFLARGKPAYVERARMTAAEAIELIHDAGGVAILAHPALNRVEDRIAEMVEDGLDGIEVWHTRQNKSRQKSLENLADSLKILKTGGSDCHGMIKGEPLLGTVRVPYERVEALKKHKPR